MQSGTEVPPDLEAAYVEALVKLPALVAAASDRDWDAHALAEAVLELSPDVLADFSTWLEDG